MELVKNDLRFVVQRLPRDIRELLSTHAGKLFVGGGFIRAIIAGEEPHDIDMFGDDAVRLEVIANDLAALRPGSRVHKSKNAITVITPDRLPVQFITRWTFTNPGDLVASFDFTVCQAAIWRSGRQSNDAWSSSISDRFYTDLAGRRLVYTSPKREEEAGGSLLRVIKYVKRGYSIQVSSLGDVVARLAAAAGDPAYIAARATAGLPITLPLVIGGLLREVDPLLVIDGFEVVDDHEPIEGEPG